MVVLQSQILRKELFGHQRCQLGSVLGLELIALTLAPCECMWSSNSQNDGTSWCINIYMIDFLDHCGLYFAVL